MELCKNCKPDCKNRVLYGKDHFGDWQHCDHYYGDDADMADNCYYCGCKKPEPWSDLKAKCE